MDWVQGLVPATALGRTRLAAVVFACVGMLGQLPQVSPDYPANRRLAGAIALALLLADFVLTYTRQRTTWLDPLLVGPALVVAGIGIRDPMAVIGLCLCTLTTQTLYGSHRTAVVRMRRDPRRWDVPADHLGGQILEPETVAEGGMSCSAECARWCLPVNICSSKVAVPAQAGRVQLEPGCRSWEATAGRLVPKVRACEAL